MMTRDSILKLSQVLSIFDFLTTERKDIPFFSHKTPFTTFGNQPASSGTQSAPENSLGEEKCTAWMPSKSDNWFT
jgi:hypothetical protein